MVGTYVNVLVQQLVRDLVLINDIVVQTGTRGRCAEEEPEKTVKVKKLVKGAEQQSTWSNWCVVGAYVPLLLRGSTFQLLPTSRDVHVHCPHTAPPPLNCLT